MRHGKYCGQPHSPAHLRGFQVPTSSGLPGSGQQNHHSVALDLQFLLGRAGSSLLGVLQTAEETLMYPGTTSLVTTEVGKKQQLVTHQIKRKYVISSSTALDHVALTTTSLSKTTLPMGNATLSDHFLQECHLTCNVRGSSVIWKKATVIGEEDIWQQWYLLPTWLATSSLPSTYRLCPLSSTGT